MKRFGFALILFFGAVIEVFPQDKLFTVEDVVGGYRLAPSNLRQLNWIPNSDIFAWSDGTGEKSVLLYSSSKSSLTDLPHIFDNQNSLPSRSSTSQQSVATCSSWRSSKTGYLKYHITYIQSCHLSFLDLYQQTEDF